VPGFVLLMAFALVALDPHMTLVRAALRGAAAAAVGLMLANALEMTLLWRKSAVHLVLIAAVAAAVLTGHFALWTTLAVFVPIAIVALRRWGKTP
jgi:hypothetical protein